ncbi:MAG: DUF4139 domain-containing protein [Polyangiaceae bacterium]
MARRRSFFNELLDGSLSSRVNMRKSLLASTLFSSIGLLFLSGCAAESSYVHTDTTLGRVVVYRNGIAYFERTAAVPGETLSLSVPPDKVNDFLKSLTVTDAKTGEPAPISYPTRQSNSETGLIDMKIKLPPTAVNGVVLTYVTESPSWKPSYRIALEDKGKVSLQAWAIVDNTSGEDWKNVKLGVGSSSALSFRFDLRSVRLVQRETLQTNDQFALAPPTGGATYGAEQSKAPEAPRLVMELGDDVLKRAEAQTYTLDSASLGGLAAGVRTSGTYGGAAGGKKGTTGKVTVSKAPPRLLRPQSPGVDGAQLQGLLQSDRRRGLRRRERQGQGLFLAGARQSRPRPARPRRPRSRARRRRRQRLAAGPELRCPHRRGPAEASEPVSAPGRQAQRRRHRAHRHIPLRVHHPHDRRPRHERHGLDPQDPDRRRGGLFLRRREPARKQELPLQRHPHQEPHGLRA